MTDTAVELMEFARRLKNEYGLHDWDVRLNNGKRVRGQVKYNPRKKNGTIFLSKYHLIHGTRKDMENTIRHEIAHALDCKERGRSAHDAVWKEIAERVGAIPKSCTESENVLELPHKYEFRCPECGMRIPRHRRLRRYTYKIHLCPDCYKKNREVKLDFYERTSMRGDE